MMLPAISPGIEVADFETELVVLVPDRRRAHLLEPMWALLFDSCAKEHTSARFLTEVEAETGWDRATTQSWLDDALRAFAESGLVAATT